ncbi:hypothetical protein CWI38_1508p0010 [Hamiltosporidium tvaerminnensis]|uniref:Ricin B lectin domain-containing protein n=1 Tax=Hamiltosporidium tvaerminnensis TaxID=1176355 RepID=A0A4Q9LSZ7_9MICR|nr:hypothetical protein CWI38_1508p0010 [Hamiltosporidium tvaerminnensis]
MLLKLRFFIFVLCSIVKADSMRKEIIGKHINIFTAKGDERRLVMADNMLGFSHLDAIVGDMDKVVFEKVKDNRYRITVNGRKMCYFNSRKNIEPCKSEKEEEDGWAVETGGDAFMIRSKYKSKVLGRPRKCLAIDMTKIFGKNSFSVKAAQCSAQDDNQLFLFRDYINPEDPPPQNTNDPDSSESSSSVKEDQPILTAMKEHGCATPSKVETTIVKRPNTPSPPPPQQTYSSSSAPIQQYSVPVQPINSTAYPTAYNTAYNYAYANSTPHQSLPSPTYNRSTSACSTNSLLPPSSSSQYYYVNSNSISNLAAPQTYTTNTLPTLLCQ